MDLNTFLLEQDKKLKEHWEDQISSYQLMGTLFESGNTVDFEFSYQFPNRMRVKVKIGPEQYYYEGYNGNRGWEMYDYVENEAEAALKHAAEWPNSILSFLDFKNRGNNVEYLGHEKIHDTEYIKIKLIHKSDQNRFYYLDKEQYEIKYIREKRKLHPNDKPVEVETVFDDFRIVDGLKIPSQITDRKVGEEKALVNILWDYASIDPEFDFKTFDKLEKQKN